MIDYLRPQLVRMVEDIIRHRGMTLCERHDIARACDCSVDEVDSACSFVMRKLRQEHFDRLEGGEK